MDRRTSEDDLPEGIVDPTPAATSNEAKEAADDADRGHSGEPATLAPDGTPDGASDAFVESAEIQQGLDPDIVTD